MIYRYPLASHFLKNIVKICPRLDWAGGLGLLGRGIFGSPSYADPGLVHPTSTVPVCRYSRSPSKESQHNLEFHPKLGAGIDGLFPKSLGAIIKEFLLTILSASIRKY